MNNSRRRMFLSGSGVAFLCLVLIFGGQLYGQVSSGSLTGVVKDPSGAVVPGAKITLTDVGKQFDYTYTTDNEGRYILRPLPPSTYKLKVEASGFSTYVQDNIVIAVSQSTSIEVSMQVGAGTQTIEVSAAAALLSTQDGATGQELNRRFINDLPLLGRGVYDLANLAPGVNQVSGGYIGGGTANNFISNGSRNVQADIIADGATTTNFEQNTGIQTSMYAPSVDMVQEFKVQQSNFSAEIGFSGSTIINMVTRSGTNAFHGTGWEFVRNNILKANDFYANSGGIPIAPRRYNLFGANVGGPIKKDKLFFFFNYEGNRDINATTYSGVGVASAAMKRGDFGEICPEGFDTNGKCKGDGQLWDPYAGATYSADEGGAIRTKIIPFNRMDLYQSPGSPVLPADQQLPAAPGNLIDPVSYKIIQYYPEPNYRVGQANYSRFNNWVGAASNKGTNNMYDTKIDYAFNDSNRISAKYSLSKGVGTSGNPWGDNPYCSAVNGPSDNIAHIFSLNYNKTFSPNTILTTTFGWARNKYVRSDTIANYPDYNPYTDLGIPSYVEKSGFMATPGIYISNYDTISPGLTDLGSQPWGIMRQATETWHLVSTLSQLRGKHELKIGGEGRLHRLNYAQPGEPNGVYDFEFNGTSEHPWWGGGDSMATFLTGSNVNGGWGGYEIPVFGATQSFQYAGYVQDNWKVTPKLTLNLGVRYDLNTPRTERFNRGSYFEPNATAPIQVPGLNLKGAVGFIDSSNRHYFSWDKNNFAPRFGFAYQLNPKTVVRGGYGVFYSIVITGASGVGSGFNGFSQTTNWQVSYQGDNVTPWGRMSNPFPNNVLDPRGSADGAKSFLGNGVGGSPMKEMVHITPYEQTWSLGFQHELPGGIILDANYVGKKGTKLYFGPAGSFNHLGPEYDQCALNPTTPDCVAMIADLNSMVPNPMYGILPAGSDRGNPTIGKASLLEPYPQYSSAGAMTLPIANSTYHSFQLKLEKRFSRGLQFLAVYTNQKSIDDASVGHGGLTWLGGSESLLDPNNRHLERSLSDYDIPQVFNFSYVYELPFGKGRPMGNNWHPVVNAILGGWKTNGIWRFSKGFPLQIGLNTSQAFPTYGGQRPSIYGGPLVRNSGANWRDDYFANPDVVIQPVSYAIGTASRTIGSVRTPGINNANMSLLKEFSMGKIREGMRFEVRGEFFNAFNHPLFCGPNTSFGSENFGKVSGTCGPAREVQMGMKLYW